MRCVAWDLECTSLSGMIGRIICGVVKDVVPPEYGNGKVRVYRGDDPKYRNRKDTADDGKLVQAIRDDLEQADIIIGHNSILFDRKFLNARLMKAGLQPLSPKFMIDSMWAIRTHLRASSKLQNIQQFLGLPDEKTPISWDQWQRGAAYDGEAIDDIVDHCIQDVLVLEEAYWRIKPLVRTISRK